MRLVAHGSGGAAFLLENPEVAPTWLVTGSTYACESLLVFLSLLTKPPVFTRGIHPQDLATVWLSFCLH